METQQMSIAKAMKHKNRVAQRISRVSSDISSYNSFLSLNEREVDVAILIQMRHDLVEHLIALKTAIHRASEPVREKIFRLAELKGTIQFYRGLSTTHGKSQTWNSEDAVEYDAVLRKKDVDAIVANLEAEVDSIQDSLDEFNASTKFGIEVPNAVKRPYAPRN